MCAAESAQVILAGDRRAAARLITRIESGDASAAQVLRELHASRAGAPVVGITGPPGAGKSTLLDQLIEQQRARGRSVGVLAVDPSSPITQGAVLGDRVRMARHNADQGIFIRSMAARGCLGGLSRAAGDALIVLNAMGFDRLFIETVGVGQNEVDVAQHADTLVVVQTPMLGDVVQSAKAGLLEVGDIYVVNRADAEGADRAVAVLRECLELTPGSADPDTWSPPIVKTCALNGDGVTALTESIDAHLQYLAAHPLQFQKRRVAQAQARILDRVIEVLKQPYESTGSQRALFEHWVGEVVAHRCDPQTAAAMIVTATQHS